MFNRFFTLAFVKILAGPALAGLVLLADIPGLSVDGERMLAVTVLMAVWWALEALPIAITALVPILLLPSLDILPMSKVASSYTHPITFLLFGGFVLALAIERCGLHMRAAYGFLSLLSVNAKYLVAGLMVIAALLSMWVSNTSTTLMLLPVAISITHMIRENFLHLSDTQITDFDVSIFLGLAYGATLGGVATIIGTPPNAFAVGFIQSTYNIDISFLEWMMFGVPLMLVMLPIVWLVLTRLMHPVNFAVTDELRQLMRDRLTSLGAFSVFEKRVMGVFLFTVLAWVSRKFIVNIYDLNGISDTSIAIFAVFLLFVIPTGDKTGEQKGTLLDWQTMSKLPWGVLLLFGGGFALAAGITSTGLSSWIGVQLAPLGMASLVVLLLFVCGVIIFLTEITSNTATATTFLPVVAALALEIGQPPLGLIIPATLAASLAFMFPVATPPNAIVFGSGQVQIRQMVRAGFVLNILSIGVITFFALYVLPLVLS